MELNRDQIIKALECCTSADKNADCPFGCPWGDINSCEQNLMFNALALIKELTEEKERMKTKLLEIAEMDIPAMIAEEARKTSFKSIYEAAKETIKADTVRKIKTQVHNKAIYPSTKGDVAYISLKAFDGIIDGYIKRGD